MSTEQIVRQVAVGDIDHDPDNPRQKIAIDADMVQSIKSYGILQPLLLRWAGDQGWILVAGARRLAHAIAAGLEEVPAIDVGELDDERRLGAFMVENIQRKDLTPLERARGFKQLADAGKTQKQIAELVGVSQATVSKSLGVLELPPKIAAKVGVASEDGIPIDSVADLLKLKDHPEVLDQVEKRTRDERHELSWEAEQALERIERDRRTAELTEQIKAKGWKSVKEARGYKKPYVALKGSGGAYFYGEQLEIDKAKHRKEPCHGAYVSTGYTGKPALVEVCTKPERHKKGGDSELKVATQPRRQRSAHEQKQLDEQKAKKAASARREEHLKTVLAKKQPAARAVPLIARALVDQLGSDERKAACAMLGLGVPDYDAAELHELADSSADGLVRVAVAAALSTGHFRARMGWAAWHGSQPVELLYGFLAETGYEPDAFETEQLGGPKPRLVPARKRATAAKEVAHRQEATAERACRVCGCTEDNACEGGCSWVPDPDGGDLCSACAERLEIELPLSRLEQKAADAAEGIDEQRDLEDGRLVSIEETKKGRRILYTVTCAICGNLGRTPATTMAFAEARRADHLTEAHGARQASSTALITVQSSSEGWSVLCSQHGPAGDADNRDEAHERAKAHIDLVHKGDGLIVEAVAA